MKILIETLKVKKNVTCYLPEQLFIKATAYLWLYVLRMQFDCVYILICLEAIIHLFVSIFWLSLFSNCGRNMPFIVAFTTPTFLDKNILVLLMFVDDILLLVRSSYFEV